MKIKKDFTLHLVGDEYIVMYSGAGNLDFSQIISLNPTAARLWESVQGKDFNAGTLVEYLVEHYEVDANIALYDATCLIKAWLEAGIIE